ncbi:hypothetical protein LWL40_27455 (plasmid) [Bacillus thuringiensis]|uniref:hypothetical protein n=1 Tax=Bacillus thuringiensis TaxID=1428 RepID=UPI003D729929
MERIAEANKHIDAYVITNEDWHEADDAKKVRIMNVAGRTLRNHYGANTIIPPNAEYEFSAYLAIVYNDTNRMQQQGIASFSVTGVGSFTFKKNNVSSPIGQALDELIPDSVDELVAQANESLQTKGRKIGWLC